MGCLLVLFGLATPRLVMVLLWLFTGYLERAFGTWVWPLLGFFFLPTTTIAYAIAKNAFAGVRGWGLVVVVLGVAIDFGLLGSARGRGLGRRD
ncbi:MAG TPA: hypothetical protein VE646_10910 [Actinomycetota bacterium]|jgi:hypothetical protein|nr:hypothetical protein [Actinomycetota bacterium]